MIGLITTKEGGHSQRMNKIFYFLIAQRADALSQNSVGGPGAGVALLTAVDNKQPCFGTGFRIQGRDQLSGHIFHTTTTGHQIRHQHNPLFPDVIIIFHCFIHALCRSLFIHPLCGECH